MKTRYSILRAKVLELIKNGHFCSYVQQTHEEYGYISQGFDWNPAVCWKVWYVEEIIINEKITYILKEESDSNKWEILHEKHLKR